MYNDMSDNAGVVILLVSSTKVTNKMIFTFRNTTRVEFQYLLVWAGRLTGGKTLFTKQYKRLSAQFLNA